MITSKIDGKPQMKKEFLSPSTTGLLDSVEVRWQSLYMEILDSFHIGLLITNPQGDVLLSNCTAIKTINRSGELFITQNNQFRARDNYKNKALQASINCMDVYTGNTKVKPVNSFTFSSPASGRIVILRIIALQDMLLEPRKNELTGCAIFIKDTSEGSHFSIDGLKLAFDLTPSESHVAELLVNGQKMEAIAHQRRTNIETVRTQLKTIYRKTNTQSQIDLMRLTYQSLLPIEQLTTIIPRVEHGFR